MSFIEIFGCEGQNAVFDGILGGVPTSSTTVPPQSKSTRSYRSGGTWRHPWRRPPSTPAWQMRFAHRMASTNGNNDTFHVGSSLDGVEGITVSTQDTTAFYTLRVAGVVVGTSTKAMQIGTAFDQVVLIVDQQAGGTVELYSIEDLVTPIVSYVLTAGDITALGGLPNETYFRAKTSDTQSGVDDVFAVDPADGVGVVDILTVATHTIKPFTVTGAGDLAEWSGTAADIDEVPFSDADAISATAVGQRSDFTKAALGEDAVSGVKLTARVLRTGTDAGENIRVYQRSAGVNAEGPDRNAPGAGSVEFYLDTARDGTAWDPAKFDGETFGFESRT